MRTLREQKSKGFDYLKKITAVDYGTYMDVLYFIYSTSDHASELVKVKIDSGSPEIDSAMEVYKAADWYERELSEMFGIKIKGRRAKRLLLEEWNGTEAPLRKSFTWGNEDYKRVS